MIARARDEITKVIVIAGLSIKNTNPKADDEALLKMIVVADFKKNELTGQLTENTVNIYNVPIGMEHIGLNSHAVSDIKVKCQHESEL